MAKQMFYLRVDDDGELKSVVDMDTGEIVAGPFTGKGRLEIERHGDEVFAVKYHAPDFGMVNEPLNFVLGRVHRTYGGEFLYMHGGA